jgi:hypothetical protein
MLDRSFAVDGATATFGWLAGVGVLCPLLVRLPGDVRIQPCVVGEFGRATARGSNTPGAASVTRPWASAGAEVRASVRLADPIRFEAAVEALAAIDRNRFDLGGTQVFDVPLVDGRLLVGVGF